MSFMFCLGACYGCKRPFSFNPERVPSIPVAGVKEPICASCVAWVNPRRREAGLPEIIVLPGAYEPTEVP
jgi:hypothetical protein